MIAFNEEYEDKAGLENLPQTKDDLRTVRLTTCMLNIKSEDTVELIDANHDQIEETFQEVRVEILPQVAPLGTSTGIGNNFKN